MCYAQLLSCVQLFVTPWSVAHQAPVSVGILQARILEWVTGSAGQSKRTFRLQPANRPQYLSGQTGYLWHYNVSKNMYLWKEGRHELKCEKCFPKSFITLSCASSLWAVFEFSQNNFPPCSSFPPISSKDRAFILLSSLKNLQFSWMPLTSNTQSSGTLSVVSLSFITVFLKLVLEFCLFLFS